MKFVTSDYVVDRTTHEKLGFKGSTGSMPPIVMLKYTPPVSISKEEEEEDEEEEIPLRCSGRRQV